jgi:hypothetical protein
MTSFDILRRRSRGHRASSKAIGGYRRIETKAAINRISRDVRTGVSKISQAVYQ